MKAKLLLSITALLLLTVALLAISATETPRDLPRGISVGSWHALSPTLGLVLPADLPRSQAAQDFPSVAGTLMAKVNGRWVVVHFPAEPGPHFLN